MCTNSPKLDIIDTVKNKQQHQERGFTMIEKTDYTKYDIYKFGIRGSIKFFVPKNKQDTDGPIIEVKCTKCGKFKTINITWDEYQTWIERGKPIYVALPRLSDSDKIWLILNRCEECM